MIRCKLKYAFNYNPYSDIKINISRNSQVAMIITSIYDYIDHSYFSKIEILIPDDDYLLKLFKTIEPINNKTYFTDEDKIEIFNFFNENLEYLEEFLR